MNERKVRGIHICTDAFTGAVPRLRQGSGSLAVEAAVAVAATADGFIDWHCRHRLQDEWGS